MLTSGGSLVGPGSLFSWKDGTNANANQAGVVELDFVTSTNVGTQQFFGSGMPGMSSDYSRNLKVGTTLDPGRQLGSAFIQLDRDYSIQVTAVLEPTTMTLACLGGLFLVGMRLRESRARRSTVA